MIKLINIYTYSRGFPGGLEGKASTCNAGDRGLIPGSGRSPGEGNGNPLQYFCLENPMDGGAWGPSWTRLSDFTFLSFTPLPSLLSLLPTSLPHSTPLGQHRAGSWAPCVISSFPPAICFTRGGVYMSVLLSQFVPPSSCAVSTSLFSTSVSFHVLHRSSSVPFF